MMYDDIAAVSTPPGEGGIAIVRLSGTGVIQAVAECFLPFNPQLPLPARASFSLNLGWIVDREKEKIDEVLVSVMRAPKSYTGEDVVEVNCHGGTLAARKCLEEFLQRGIRLAEPGEFTKRAFLSGRLDLSQAEAVVDIIRAKNEKAMKMAVSNLEGKNSAVIKNIEDRLIRLNAMVEASVDFPEDVGELDYREAGDILLELEEVLNKLIRAGERGEIYREGVNVAICGKPNVGKSSLLNALIRKDKAIVTDIPGTTRDVIEDYINIRGIPVKIMDTAGIRGTEDLVEQIGVEKSIQVIENADLAIFMLDMGTGISQEDMDLYIHLKNKKAIILLNKEDLAHKHIKPEDVEKIFKGFKIITASVIEDRGMDELEDAIENMVLEGKLDSDDLDIMFNMRQKKALLKARSTVQELRESLESVPLDCLGVDVWEALEAVGEISGKTLKEEVIDRIFRDFCIGK